MRYGGMVNETPRRCLVSTASFIPYGATPGNQLFAIRMHKNNGGYVVDVCGWQTTSFKIVQNQALCISCVIS